MSKTIVKKEKEKKLSKQDIQAIVNNLFEEHGPNVSNWADWKDKLKEHDLRPDQVTDLNIERAKEYVKESEDKYCLTWSLEKDEVEASFEVKTSWNTVCGKYHIVKIEPRNIKGETYFVSLFKDKVKGKVVEWWCESGTEGSGHPKKYKYLNAAVESVERHYSRVVGRSIRSNKAEFLLKFDVISQAKSEEKPKRSKPVKQEVEEELPVAEVEEEVEEEEKDILEQVDELEKKPKAKKVVKEEVEEEDNEQPEDSEEKPKPVKKTPKKEEVKTPRVRGDKEKTFGQSISRLSNWMGQQDWTVDECLAVYAALGVEVKRVTVYTEWTGGRNPKYIKDVKLSEEDIKTLNKLRKQASSK